MAKKIKVKTAADIASELLDCRKAIAEWKAIEKPLADELKKRIKAGEDQDSFKITTSSSFKVSNQELALRWAHNYAEEVITVDATAARKKFLQDVATGSMGSPESNGFAFVETEKLVAFKGEEE